MRRSTTRSTSGSSTRISIRTFGTKSMVYSAPRYTSVWPRWRPKPWTSDTVRPWTPRSLTASFTSSSLNGLMIPTMSFISDSNHGAPRRDSHALQRVAHLGVLREVEPGLFVLFGNPDTTREDPVERIHDHERQETRPDDRRDHGNELVPHQLPAAADEHALVHDRR